MISRTISFSFPPMQLRFFLTALLFNRSSLPGKMSSSRGIKSGSGGNSSVTRNHNVAVDRNVSIVVKRGYSSITGQNSQIAKKETEFLVDSTNEAEFPSLLASVSIGKNKRRTRIDLRTQLEQKSEQGVDETGSSQHDNSLNLKSENQPYESNAPRISSKQGERSKISPGVKKVYVERSKQFSQEPSLPLFSSQPNKQNMNFRSHPDRSSLHRISPERGVGLKNSSEIEFKPFDICFCDSRRKVFRKPPLPMKQQGIQEEMCGLENAQVLRPGMVLFKNYIPLDQQVEIILRCRELGLGPGGFYKPGYEDGAKLRLHMMCLGQDWDPQTRKYGNRRQHDNSKPPDIPLEFNTLVKRVLQDAHTLIQQQSGRKNVEEILPTMSPDICIVNFYTANGRLGLHKDQDESRDSLLKGLPVVSFSIGDSAEFLYGDQRDIEEAKSILLESGDVLIFGGESRLVFHGVTSILPKTAPRALSEHAKLRHGRLNLTFRQY